MGRIVYPGPRRESGAELTHSDGGGEGAGRRGRGRKGWGEEEEEEGKGFGVGGRVENWEIKGGHCTLVVYFFFAVLSYLCVLVATQVDKLRDKTV